MAYTQKNHTNDVKLMKPTNNRRAHGFRRAISAACLFVLFISGGSALAESFTYNGSTPPLQNAPDPAATANSLFPGTTADPGASGNTVTIDFTSGANPARVFGGISNIADSVGNTVNLIRGTITSRIYGGYGGTIGDATDNTVTMSGGSVGDRVVGGHSINGDAIGNRVTMSGGTAGYLYGGTAGDTGNATGNSVTMTGGNAGSIYGASAIAGNASGNSVTINGATARVTGWALGAINSSGVVENNTVTLIDGNVNSITAGQTTTGTSRNNTLIISGGTLMGGEGGTSIGTGLVENNTVRFTGGDVGAALTGGTARDGVSRGNVLIMSGGTVFASITGGYSDSGTATATPSA